MKKNLTFRFKLEIVIYCEKYLILSIFINNIKDMQDNCLEY